MKFPIALVFAAFFCIRCASSLTSHVAESTTLEPSVESPLVTAALPPTAGPEDPPGKESGFHPLIEGFDAFDARITLVDAAVTSLDLQYYIWHRDKTGVALLSRILDAAERGVRVRILIDDMNLGQDREYLAQLDRHPLVEIRVYNPTSTDGQGLKKIVRGLEIVFGFDKMNRRMHNKVMIGDNSFSIIGGRNIGDEYFDLKKDRNFRDLDLLCAGPVTRDFSVSFDEFWASSLSFGLKVDGEVLPPANAAEWKEIRVAQKIEKEAEVAKLFANQSDHAKAPDTIKELSKKLVWAPAKAIYDSPKGARQKKKLEDDLKKVPDAKNELLIESAYFIPPDPMLKRFKELEARGAKVRILTNSLISNDVLIAHSGYQAKREAILKTGSDLYEWRNTFVKVNTPNGGGIYASRAGLHSKAFVVDRKYLFIGSMNLDPRSIDLNTESGVLVESPKLSETIAKFIESGMTLKTSWKVTLECKEKSCESKDRQVTWRGQKDGKNETLYEEPDASIWKQFLTGGLSLLPIEDSL